VTERAGSWRNWSYAVIAANRQNARRSTGPRTPAGKAKAARNSLRHGLSRPVRTDPALAREVETCACRIAGEGASPARHALAVAVAEAEVDLARIARVRQLLTAERAAGRNVEKQLLAIDRYARRARFRHKLALEDLGVATTGADGEGAQNKAKPNEPAQNEPAWQNKAKPNEPAQNEPARQNKAKPNEAEPNEADWQNKAEQNEAEPEGVPISFQKVIAR